MILVARSVHGRSAGWLPPSGWERQGPKSGQGAAELVFLGPTLWKMQGEAARRAGEPSGDGEEASPEGLGGHQLLAQTDARRPAGRVMCHHPVSNTGQALDGQPGGVGWEATRGEMVEPDAVLEVANGILDLGVAAMVGLESQGVTVSVSDAAVIAVVDEEGQLCTGRIASNQTLSNSGRTTPPGRSSHGFGVARATVGLHLTDTCLGSPKGHYVKRSVR